MDMQKIGRFLKVLRKEKGLSQEQLAEKLGVSGRTVSRWETAINMPDLSILIQLSEFYQVSVKEILNGERDDQQMNNEMKETLTKVADYNKAEKEKALKVLRRAFGITTFTAFAAWLVQGLIFNMDLQTTIGELVIILVSSVAYLIMTAKNGLAESPELGKNLSNGQEILLLAGSALLFGAIIGITCYRMGDSIWQAVLAGGIGFVGTGVASYLILLAVKASNKKNKNKQRKED